MQEIDAAKGASHDGVDRVLCAFELDLGVSSTVGEYVTLAQFDEGKFCVVAMGKEICRIVSDFATVWQNTDRCCVICVV